jgi:rod shape determining protein RodA
VTAAAGGARPPGTRWETAGRGVRLQREALARRWGPTRSPARRVDVVLLLTALALTAIGLALIYSATAARLALQGDDPLHYVQRQGLALALGLVATVVVMAPDYRHYRLWAPVLYALSLAMLVITAATGTTVNASRAWIVFGGFQFQPAEVAKPALILMLAALFPERRESALGLRALVEAVAIAAAPMVLILAQPDLGTAIVFVAITFGVLLLARVRVRFLVALALIGALSLAGAYQLDILKQYQVERLTTFLAPDAVDLQEAGYNVNQAQIAVGSGGLLGRGYLQGSQTGLSYVPENHTDFIFTVAGEEFGFLGASILLGLFALLLWRALRIAATARDTFGTLIAGGVVAVLAFQLFVNVGMSMGIMPVTGLPLPFVSYGGTSLIGSLLMIGLLQNVHMRR